MQSIRCQIRTFRERAKATRELAYKAITRESRDAHLKFAAQWDALANEIEAAFSPKSPPRPETIAVKRR
jgi:hypothetical protein